MVIAHRRFAIPLQWFGSYIPLLADAVGVAAVARQVQPALVVVLAPVLARGSFGGDESGVGACLRHPCLRRDREEGSGARVERRGRRIESVHANPLGVAAVGGVSLPHRHRDGVLPNAEVQIRGRGDLTDGRPDRDVIA